MGQHEITVMPDGTVCGLVVEDLDLRDLGTIEVRRVSHVEWDNERQAFKITWANGEVCAHDFPTRKAALDYEKAAAQLWIDCDHIEEVLG